MLANSVFKEFAEWLLERAKDVPNLPLEEQLDNLLGLTDDESGDLPVNSLANFYFSPEKLDKNPEAYLTILESLRTLRPKTSRYESLTKTQLWKIFWNLLICIFQQKLA